MDQPQLLLIVEKVSKLPEDLPQQLDTLTEKFGIDAYTARQRLTGQGFGFFAGAAWEELEKTALFLTHHGIANWIIGLTPPPFDPLRARGLEIGDDRVCFLTGEQRIGLERGDRVIAILADLTGDLVQRNLEKLGRRLAYLGADSATFLSQEERYQTVLRNQPVLDLYLLDAENDVRQAVRLLAGRYDPSGLGSRKTCGTAGNINAIVQLVREYAGEFILHTDFGLTNYPGCELKRLEAHQRPDPTHLTPVTRFGWLMVEMYGRQRPDPKPAAPETISAYTVLGPPAAIATAALTGALASGFEDLGTGIQTAPGVHHPERNPTARVLPPPPRLEPFIRRRFRWTWPLAIGAAILSSKGVAGKMMENVIQLGLQSGIAPGFLSLLFGGLGFRNFVIKRHIENLPTSKVRSVAMGMVEVQGYVRRKYALVAPMSMQPCVFYALRKYRRDRESGVWKEYGVTDCGPVPFDLEDETGRLTVDPAGAKVKAEHRKEERRESLGFTLTGSNDADEKWVEEVIPEGAFVYVTGFAREPARTAKSLKERTLAALRNLKQDPQRLRQYDADGDQRISEEEWQTAREAVEQQVLEAALDEGAAPVSQGSQVIIGCPTRRELPFIIAETRSEKKLARGYALTAAAQLVVGLGFGIFALTRLVYFFNGPG